MKKYQTGALHNTDSVMSDLKHGKINKSQSNFLLGVILKKEINEFVQWQIKTFLPPQQDKSMTFVQYAHKRNLKQNA